MAINADTVVDVTLSFKEPSGSVYPYRARATLGKLGVAVEEDAVAKVPTAEEVQEALNEDARKGYARPEDSAFVKLSARYAALNQKKGTPLSQRLREALVKFLSTGGVPDHKIDNAKYTWQGGENAMLVTSLTDDAAGTITGTPNAQYFQVTGSAVWGF